MSYYEQSELTRASRREIEEARQAALKDEPATSKKLTNLSGRVVDVGDINGRLFDRFIYDHYCPWHVKLFIETDNLINSAKSYIGRIFHRDTKVQTFIPPSLGRVDTSMIKYPYARITRGRNY